MCSSFLQSLYNLLTAWYVQASMNEYKPTVIDRLWVENLIKITGDGAVWGWPDTGLIYRLSHKDKCLILLNPDRLSDAHARIGHDRTIVVFQTIGYTVKPIQ